MIGATAGNVTGSVKTVIFAFALFFIMPCYAAQTPLPADNISSWRYAGIDKEAGETKVITKKIDEVITKWDDIIGAHMVKWPMRKGEEWGHVNDLKRTDHGYCYYVSDVKNKDLSYIKGINKGMHKVYTIRYKTMADHEETDFAEGIGIIRYEFVHHGTVDEEYLKLVEVKGR